jgi:hypothetical protein
MREPATILPGRTVEITVNLLTHYDLRQRGTFTARALVDVEGTRVLSPPDQVHDHQRPRNLEANDRSAHCPGRNQRGIPHVFAPPAPRQLQ